MNKVSVVTVAYNAAESIRSTILSVLGQTYENYEYVVVDGKSCDDTCSIVDSYKQEFEKKGIRLFLLSEPDDGIYDAMNKAVSYCTGDWIIYMNADDAFANANVLENIFRKKNYNEVDCIYGATWNTINGMKYYKKSYPVDYVYYRNPFVHQALFARKDVITKYPFDLQYSILADYDQVARMYLGECRFLRVEQVIAEFSLEGISQTNDKEVYIQRKKIQKNNGLYKRKKMQRFIYEKIILNVKKNEVIKYVYRFLLSLKNS